MPKRIFISYSRTDALFRSEFTKHLNVLQSAGLVESWHDGTIPPGEDWREAIEANLETADVIVFLMSPDFLSSQFCQDVEMPRALARWTRRRVRIIPILVRECLWEKSPLAKLQVLPRNGLPIAAAPNTDAGWTQVVRDIREMLEKSTVATGTWDPTRAQTARMRAESGAEQKDPWRTDAVDRFWATWAPPLAFFLFVAAGLVTISAAISVGSRSSGRCPSGTTKVGEGSQTFCIDREPLTADSYLRCVARKDCSEPKTTEKCANIWSGHQVLKSDCVEQFQLGLYCAASGKRLPSDAELTIVDRTPAFELPGDLAKPGFRCASDHGP